VRVEWRKECAIAKAEDRKLLRRPSSKRGDFSWQQQRQDVNVEAKEVPQQKGRMVVMVVG
jgi:hypothetical protein